MNQFRTFILLAGLTALFMGVGYLIGPKIASWMMAGAVLSFFVIGPLIAHFGENLTEPVKPARTEMKDGVNIGLINNMGHGLIYKWYLKYIGAGAVAAVSAATKAPR